MLNNFRCPSLGQERVFSLGTDPFLTLLGRHPAPFCRFLLCLAKRCLPVHTLPSLPPLVPYLGDVSWGAYLPPWRQSQGCAWDQSRWNGGTSGTWHRSGIYWLHRCRNKCPAGCSTWSWQGYPNLAGKWKKRSISWLLPGLKIAQPQVAENLQCPTVPPNQRYGRVSVSLSLFLHSLLLGLVNHLKGLSMPCFLQMCLWDQGQTQLAWREPAA